MEMELYKMTYKKDNEKTKRDTILKAIGEEKGLQAFGNDSLLQIAMKFYEGLEEYFDERVNYYERKFEPLYNTNNSYKSSNGITSKNLEKNKDEIRILGGEFVRSNLNKGKLVINNKKYNLKEYINIKNVNKDNLKIKMVLNKNIYNKSYMFKDCEMLFELEISTNNKSEDVEIIQEVNNCKIFINEVYEI